MILDKEEKEKIGKKRKKRRKEKKPRDYEEKKVKGKTKWETNFAIYK